MATNQPGEATQLDEVDQLLDATAEVAKRAGYKTDADIEARMMMTPIKNPQGCAHEWEGATTSHDKRLSRRCVDCGRVEQYGGPISDGERAEAMAQAAVLRAQKMAGLPGYYPDEDAPEPSGQIQNQEDGNDKSKNQP